jgi:hypothetical protein
MNRLSRLALAGSTALTLAITHSYLGFVEFDYLLSDNPQLNTLANNLGRLETALTLITLALTTWALLPKKEQN